MACCLLQNHIREHMPVDPIENDYGNNLRNEEEMARRGKSNRVWTIEEDAKLVESIVELKRSKNWDGESGSGLRKGYQKELEKILQEKLPGNGLKEKPHIESRCKLLKKQYHAIYDVRANGELSGFGWDDERKCVTASADVWADYLKSHPDCTFMKNKSFPYFDQLSIVWGKDRAAGLHAEVPLDVVEELDREENVDQVDGESGEDGVPSLTTPRDEGTSKRLDRKRRRSSDGFISSLERMTNVLVAYMDKSNDQMNKILESVTGGDKEKKDNRHMLYEKLQEIEALTDSQRQKAVMKLVRDPDLLDYFFTLHDEGAKKMFLIELLG
ncbi:uncharacterized protein At2g29880-like [Salvia splendens]|uniref:uncharacterized protein At2g29880-like n=1 Tax=Salvia splendens TaxID=180675 RepID=UPI001C26308A|nr:uncharacterized protein At2g29880-like [Salvia splendens]